MKRVIYNGDYRYIYSNYRLDIQCFGRDLDTGEDISWRMSPKHKHYGKFKKSIVILFEANFIDSSSTFTYYIRKFKDISEEYPHLKLVI